MTTPTQAEQWKPIAGYEGLYEISDQGRVRSKTRIFGDKPDPFGYCRISLRKNLVQKNAYVHILVLEHFVSPRPVGCECRHLNGKSTDNRLENLSWGSPKENGEDRVLHGTSTAGSKNVNAILTEEKVIEMRRIYKQGKLKKAQIARMFGVSATVTGDILNGKRWKHI